MSEGDPVSSPLSNSFIWNRVRDNRMNDSSSADGSFDDRRFNNDVTDDSLLQQLQLHQSPSIDSFGRFVKVFIAGAL